MSNSSRGQRSKSALGVVLRPPGYVGFLASFGTGSFPSIIRGGLEQRRRAGEREGGQAVWGIWTEWTPMHSGALRIQGRPRTVHPHRSWMRSAGDLPACALGWVRSS